MRPRSVGSLRPGGNSTGGDGYSAQWRDRHGKGRGQRFTALTLDQLAAILEREASRRSPDDL